MSNKDKSYLNRRHKPQPIRRPIQSLNIPINGETFIGEQKDGKRPLVENKVFTFGDHLLSYPPASWLMDSASE